MEEPRKPGATRTSGEDARPSNPNRSDDRQPPPAGPRRIGEQRREGSHTLPDWKEKETP
jgi:hypothetical protein